MKIAVLLPGYLPVPAIDGGAIETLLTGLIKENENKFSKIEFYIFLNNVTLKRLDTKTYKNTVFVNIKKNKMIQSLIDIYYRFIRKIQKSDILLSYYLTKSIGVMKKNNFDYIYIDGRIDYVIPIYNSVKTPIILHVHTDILNCSTLNGKKIASSTYKIIAISNYIKDRISKIDLNLSPKIFVIKNAVDLTLFNRNSFNTLSISPYKSKDNEKVLLYCGRLDPMKGLLYLIKAIEMLKDESIVLYIIGSSWFKKAKKDSFYKIILEYQNKYKNQIKLLQYIDNWELPKYYFFADLTVMPSLYNEAGGLVVLESQAMNTPVLSTNKGGLPEYNELKHMIIEAGDDLSYRLKEKISDYFINYSGKKNFTKSIPLPKDYNEYYIEFIELLK